MKTISILYIPVLHSGYIEFFKKHASCFVYIIGDEIINEFSKMHKEIRQVNPIIMKKIVAQITKKMVEILTPEIARGIKGKTIITATDTVSRNAAEKYLAKSNKLLFDTIFLMWSEENVNSSAKITPDRISTNETDRKIMKELAAEMKKSSDWWRRNGVAMAKNGKIKIKAHNQHLPSEHTPYALGDPRDFIKAGKDNHIATSLHAEQAVIAEAAERGLATKNLDLYSLIFPCPMCSKIIAFTGIKRLFFQTGHASLNGLEILKSKKIEIILVK